MNALHGSGHDLPVRQLSVEAIHDLRSEYRPNEWKWKVDA
jgi:hypothetical protein